MNFEKMQIPIYVVIAILTLYPYFRVSLFGDNRSLRFYAPASAGAFFIYQTFAGGNYMKKIDLKFVSVSIARALAAYGCFALISFIMLICFKLEIAEQRYYLI